MQYVAFNHKSINKEIQKMSKNMIGVVIVNRSL